MSKVTASITTSLDGYIAGPDDGPAKDVGEGGGRLHSWVCGGRWAYGDAERGEPSGEDAAWLAAMRSRLGAVLAGRSTYEAAGHWGDRNPAGVPFFVVTHRPEEQPPTGEFVFVAGVEEAVRQAREAADGKDVNIMGGAGVIRQALAAGLVDELSIVIAPLILGAGKRLFDGFSRDLELEHLGVRQSPFATFIDYRIV